MKYLAILLFLSSNAFALNCATIDPSVQAQCYRDEAYYQHQMDQTNQVIRDTMNRPAPQENYQEIYYQNQQNQKLEQQNELLQELLNK